MPKSSGKLMFAVSASAVYRSKEELPSSTANVQFWGGGNTSARGDISGVTVRIKSMSGNRANTKKVGEIIIATGVNLVKGEHGYALSDDDGRFFPPKFSSRERLRKELTSAEFARVEEILAKFPHRS